MKKFKILLFSIGFLIIFFGTSFTINANQQQEKDINITITSYFNEDDILTNSVTGRYGSKLSFADIVLDKTGYEFAYWVVNGVVKKNATIDNEFIINENMDIKAIFKPSGQYAVLFMDSNGKLLDIQYVNPGSNASDPDITLPDKPGYKVSDVKWNKSLDNITSDTVITLVYEKELEEEYLVTVNGGIITSNGLSSGNIPFNEVVTIEANEAPTGKYFRYWLVNNNIVSTKSTYSFTVLSDITINAVYGDTPNSDVPFIMLSSPYSLRTGYNSFVGQFYLPNNYTLVEYGILSSSNNEELELNTSGVTRNKSLVYYSNTNEFLMSIPIDKSVSARAYLVCKDESGNLITIYNQVIKQSNPTVNLSIDASKDSPSELGWTYSSMGTSSGYFEFKTANGYIQSPKFSAISGPITFTMNATATGTATNNTFTITAYDANDNIVETHTKSISGAGISSSNGSTYYDYSYEFNNTNKNISYIRFTYNKEASGSNIRIKTISIVEEGVAKTISYISANIPVSIYKIDESINLTNALLTVYYTDGTYSTINITSDMVSGFNTTSAGSKTATINYQGYTTNFNYTVKKLNPTYTLPEIPDQEYYEGLSLYDISLPDGFTWESDDVLLEIGSNTFMVKYTPNNTDRYNVVNNIPIIINVYVKSNPLIIYEVYGGGGNSGAPYSNDYVVLYNASNSPIDLSNYSLQYASSTGTSYSVLNLSGSINSLSYYLIQLGSNNTSVGSPLPVTANAFSSTMNLSSTAGKIALVNSQTKINNSTDKSVVDFVGYGSANEFEGQPTGTLSNTTSARRRTFIDSNNNYEDFYIGKPDLTYLVESRVLVGISVNGIKKYYEIGDPIDITNAKLVLHYQSGVTELMTLTMDMISGFDSSSLGEKELTITYQSFTTKFTYSIIDYSSIDEAYVYYIDIGATGGKAGETALIKVGNIEVLIDSGDNDSNSESELLDFLASKVYDGVIEYVIASHPDADHIGGMDVVYREYQIANTILYSTYSSSPSNMRKEFESIVANEGGNTYYIADLVVNNPVIELSTGFELRFYNTTYLTSSNNNASSIVFTFEAFNTRVLFNGDAEKSQEEKYAPLVGNVDIFKLGHHGSSNGTSTTLLNYIKPEVAIVTNGDYLGNQYSHPTYEAISRIYDYSVATRVYAVTGGNGSGVSRMHQRNGDITITISSSGYDIDSEYYGEHPIELSATDYWKNSNNKYSSKGSYYKNVYGNLSSSELKQVLHDIIKGHTKLSYSDVWDALMDTDEDPNNPNNVILLYSGISRAKSNHGAKEGQWNREHVWAKSHGGFGETMGPGTDIHHLRPTDVNVNSTRGNKDFDYGGNKTHPNCTVLVCRYDDDSWEPDDSVKGDVARMLFYMAVRYEGGDGYPDLELNDLVNNDKTPYFGRLSVLLEWHELDPVDDFERRRNDIIFKDYQHNRNPFIDCPELARLVFSK